MSKSLRVVWGTLLTALLIIGSTWSRTGRAQEGGSSNNEPAVSPAGEGRHAESFVPGRILLKFRAGTSDAHARGLLASYGARTASRISGIDVHVVELPQTAVEEHFVQTFSAIQEVEFAELDRILAPEEMTPNDPYYSNQWHLRKIAASTAWSNTTGSPSVIIAILDSGVDGSHPDLTSKLVPGWNIYDNNPDTSDIQGHGTAVAGTTAAASNNGLGVASVAWGCKIMPVRISDPNGGGTLSNIASGLTWAADHGARVANISYQVTTSLSVTSAANYFQSKGGVVAVSAGNSGTFNSAGDNPSMLTVSGTDSNDVLASWSNTGNYVDLAAPGVSIRTTNRGGGYGSWTGTSFSAPVVAGVAALVISANPSLTAPQVQDVLNQSADDLGTAGWDANYGWGRVNAERAVNLALGYGGSGDTTPPTASFISPTAGATVSGTVTVEVLVNDNVGVTSLSLNVDGASLGTDTSSPYSFQWDTKAATNGAHTLTATASDAAGNTSSTSITVTVGNYTDTTPPSVTITSPFEGAAASGNVSVYVNAADNVGVVRNELYVDGVLTSTSTAAPFTNKWNARRASPGAHKLQCKAFDAAGNVGLSQVVTVYK
jgi:thermitase